MTHKKYNEETKRVASNAHCWKDRGFAIVSIEVKRSTAVEANLHAIVENYELAELAFKNIDKKKEHTILTIIPLEPLLKTDPVSICKAAVKTFQKQINYEDWDELLYDVRKFDKKRWPR